MANPIKYTTGSETLALKKGNFYIGTGDVGKGPTSSTGFYNGVDVPSGGYTIYVNNGSQPGGLSYFSAANDSQLITYTNNLAGTSYTTAAQCLVYFAGQTDKVVLNRNYESIVTNGLVLNLDAGFTPSYPQSGTTWYDLSINNLNGTLTNGPTFNSGNGGSVVFDGTDDFVVCPPTSAWGNNPFTLISWCYPEFDYYIYGAPMLTKAVDCSGGIEWAFEYGRQSNKFSIYGGSFPGGPVKYATNTYPKNNWYHACVTYDGTNLTFYINGSQDSTSTGFYPGNGNGQIALATYYGCGPVNEWLGKISIGQVYNRALSAAEVSQNYNAQKSRFGL